jgi:hypothetical protein
MTSVGVRIFREGALTVFGLTSTLFLSRMIDEAIVTRLSG